MDLEFITKTIISLFALPIEQIVTFAIFIIVLVVGAFIIGKKYEQADNLQHHKTNAECDLYKKEQESKKQCFIIDWKLAFMGRSRFLLAVHIAIIKNVQ